MKIKKTFFIWILFVIISLGELGFLERTWAENPSPKSWSFVSVGLIPTQSGGRIKPLDSFARETVLFITGSRTFSGWNPLDLLFSWISYPQFWEMKAFIQINRGDVRRQLGLDEKQIFYSPYEILNNVTVIQYAQRMSSGKEGSEPPGAPRTNPREQELRRVLDRVSLFRSLVSGQSWLLVPSAAPNAWLSVLDPIPKGKLIRNQFSEVIRAFQLADRDLFEKSSFLLRAAVEGEIPEYHSKLKSTVSAESLYNRFRPFLIAWIFYLLAALSWTIGQFVEAPKNLKKLRNVSLFLTMIAVLSHVFGFGLRCFVAGRPPVTNMYESIIWVSLGIVLFAFILYAIHKQSIILAVATFLAMLGLIAGDAAPAILDPSLHPLVPVLRSNYWLTIHVLTITLGYAAFALTLGLANITLFQFFKRKKGPEITSLNQLTYRAMQFGVVLIAAGTILGGIWADYSWGRFWGWDPKEVWALITLLCYLVILHGRYTNWFGQFAFAAGSALSFLSVVMAWYGVNFILGVGLHSYGFSTGGTPWVISFVVLQLLYVLAATVVHLRSTPR